MVSEQPEPLPHFCHPRPPSSSFSFSSMATMTIDSYFNSKVANAAAAGYREGESGASCDTRFAREYGKMYDALMSFRSTHSFSDRISEPSAFITAIEFPRKPKIPHRETLLQSSSKFSIKPGFKKVLATTNSSVFKKSRDKRNGALKNLDFALVKSLPAVKQSVHLASDSSNKMLIGSVEIPLNEVYRFPFVADVEELSDIDMFEVHTFKKERKVSATPLNSRKILIGSIEISLGNEAVNDAVSCSHDWDVFQKNDLASHTSGTPKVLASKFLGDSGDIVSFGEHKTAVGMRIEDFIIAHKVFDENPHPLPVHPKTTSPSVFLVVPKIASPESLAGNLPDSEKIHVVISGESELNYSDDITAQKENIQFLQLGASVPKDAMNEQKEKSEEISDLEPNFPLPLIPISRVLKDIPQCPHFFPLRKFSELLREKLMAALDQTFEDIVVLIHGLTNANDFLERASDLWMAAGELDNMGYTLFLISRSLLEMKDVVTDLVERNLTIFELKIIADYHRVKKNRLLNLILSLKNKVAVEELNKEQLLNKVNILEEELSNSDDLKEIFVNTGVNGIMGCLVIKNIGNASLLIDYACKVLDEIPQSKHAMVSLMTWLHGQCYATFSACNADFLVYDRGKEKGLRLILESCLVYDNTAFSLLQC